MPPPPHPLDHLNQCGCSGQLCAYAGSHLKGLRALCSPASGSSPKSRSPSAHPQVQLGVQWECMWSGAGIAVVNVPRDKHAREGQESVDESPYGDGSQVNSTTFLGGLQ